MRWCGRSRSASSTQPFSRLIQQVNDDHTVVEVASRHGNSVIMSKDDYDAITETAYLLRNPAKAERLLTAIERVRRGEFKQHDLTAE
nr:type II toxin-antitoxin system prevent-host-death family antitoxin [Cryobacterium sp. M91]